MQTILSRLGAVRCLFFKSEQFQLIDMPIHVGPSVDKHGHRRQGFTRIQAVRVAKPVQPDMFGGEEPTKNEKHSARLDAFIRKHGGLGQLAHLMLGMTEAQRNRLHAEMAKLGGKTADEVAAMLASVKPEAAAQGDMFAQPVATPVDVDNKPSPEQPEVEPAAPKEYRYAMVNRPAGIGTVPKDLVRAEDRPVPSDEHYAYARNGVSVFNRKLTDAETKSFELALMTDGDERAAVADTVADSLGKYASQYVEMSADNTDRFESIVAQHIKSTAAGYPPSVGSIGKFADLVRDKLKERIAAEVQGPRKATTRLKMVLTTCCALDVPLAQ